MPRCRQLITVVIAVALALAMPYALAANAAPKGEMYMGSRTF